MRYAVYLAATDGNNVSGMLALYSGAIRYDVPFHDLVADDGRNSTKPTVIVVKFPAPVAIESAVVSALDTGNGNTHCSIPFAPWTVEAAQGTEPAPKRTMEWFRGAVAAAEIVAAPAPVNDPRPCATPDRAGRTVKAYEPETAENFTLKGDVVVVVTIDEKDHLIGAEILESSGSGDMDNIAVGAAMRSQFAGATFRCRPIVGEYRFVVSFGD
jgi:outer membrane biosynthesis protein TonB